MARLYGNEHAVPGWTSAFELGALVHVREVSPVELVDLLPGDIGRLDPELRASLTVVGDEAPHTLLRRVRRCGPVKDGRASC